MKTRRCIVPQILATLLQADGGVPVAELCREHGMNNASFYVYGCRSHFKGLRPDPDRFPNLRTSVRLHRISVRPVGNSAW